MAWLYPNALRTTRQHKLALLAALFIISASENSRD
jgi:hypothetical protein